MMLAFYINYSVLYNVIQQNVQVVFVSIEVVNLLCLKYFGHLIDIYIPNKTWITG